MSNWPKYGRNVCEVKIRNSVAEDMVSLNLAVTVTKMT